MILDKLENLKKYLSLNKNFRYVFDFISNNDLLSLPLGKLMINENVYLIRQQYIGKNFEDNIFESHIDYIDVQIILNGTEKSFYSTDLPTINEKNINDAYFSETTEKSELIQNKNEFVIYFPNELHKPGINVNNEIIEKVVFKVKCSSSLEEI